MRSVTAGPLSYALNSLKIREMFTFSGQGGLELALFRRRGDGRHGIATRVDELEKLDNNDIHISICIGKIYLRFRRYIVSTSIDVYYVDQHHSRPYDTH